LVSMMTLFFAACKNDKATKVMDKAKDTVENVVDGAEEVVDKVEGEIADAGIDLGADSEPNTIGSDELAELKKAEEEQARKPKVNKEKGQRPTSVPKPRAGSAGSPKPT